MIERTGRYLLTACTVSLLFFGRAGAQSADDDPPARLPAQESAREIDVPPRPPSPPPWFGGYGGSPSVLMCPFIYGFSGRTGIYFDHLALKCFDETRLWTTNGIGGLGGTAFDGSDTECPEDYWAVGFAVNSSRYIHSIALICRNQDAGEVTTALHGGPGGTNQQYKCPKNYHLTGINARSGIYVDGFQAMCDVDPPKTP